MISYVGLDSAVKLFVNNSKDSTITLNVYRDNGEVLLQLFKVKNILNWDHQFHFNNSDGHVLVISFSKSKTDNVNNFIRFTQSDWRTSFHPLPPKMGDSYYYHFESVKEDFEIYNNLEQMIIDFFGGPKEVKFEVAIW